MQYQMRLLCGSALVAAVSAQTAVITSVDVVTSVTPTNAIVTSVHQIYDQIPFTLFGSTNIQIPTVTAMSGSIITVNPSGTVVKVDCPYTEGFAAALCPIQEAISQTLRPTGTEYLGVTDYRVTIGNAVATANLEGICTPVGDDDLACTSTIRVNRGGVATRDTTTTTYTSVSLIPLTLTGGLDKTGSIPTASPTSSSNDDDDDQPSTETTSNPAAMRTPHAIAGAVGIVAAAAAFAL